MSPPGSQSGSPTVHVPRPGSSPHRLARFFSRAQLRTIAERKMPDLNANDVDAAINIIAGTARSMGVEVAG